MKDVFIIIYKPGPAWIPGKPNPEQRLQSHGKHLLGLYRSGALRFAGPFPNSPGGAAVIEAAGAEEARRIADNDPAVLDGIFVYELNQWQLLPWEQYAAKADSALHRDLLSKTYRAFNARDIDAVLAVMHPDVDWPNGWEGGRIIGREGIRDYWTRQWQAIDPCVDPVGFQLDPDGRTVVKVHSVVRDLNGTIVAEDEIEHVYLIQDGLIRSMEIRKP